MTMIEKVLKNKEAVKRALQDEQEKAYNLYCNTMTCTTCAMKSWCLGTARRPRNG